MRKNQGKRVKAALMSALMLGCILVPATNVYALTSDEFIKVCPEEQFCKRRRLGHFG